MLEKKNASQTLLQTSANWIETSREKITDHIIDCDPRRETCVSVASYRPRRLRQNIGSPHMLRAKSIQLPRRNSSQKRPALQ